jgi:rhodanese-related sulfurtransferase
VSLSTVTPRGAHPLIKEGALLIDIRRADEHAREHIPGTRNHPVDSLTGTKGKPVIFHCMSGLRTQIYAAKLAAASGDGFVLEGGLEAWKKEGLPVLRGAFQ